MVRLLAVITTICLLSGLIAPAARATRGSRAGSSDEFSFMAMLGGEPVRWNPCEPIHYVVNLGAAPPVRCRTSMAVLRISSATGSRSCSTG